MRARFYLLFIFYSLLFLFYPGDSDYFHLFAYNRPLFNQPPVKQIATPKEIPYVIFPYAPSLTAKGVYIVDLPTFTPVFARNANTRLFPASTSKIVTALVAYDVYKPEQVLTVKTPLGEGQVMGLVPGERITVENLLYGTLVNSGNDAAYALANAYGLSKFVELMNEKAKQLHMEDSHFSNPAGLDQDGIYTTPFDLALAGRELLKNSYLSKIVSTKEIIISDVDFKIFHTLTNVNKLLGEIQGIGGLKTGYTEEAGENLVSLYKRSDGHEFIIVIMKSLDRFQDTTNAVNWINADVGYWSR
jgi:D-alanyl-D-alanine carboxypeptidase